MPDSRQTLLNIVHCPNVSQCFRGGHADHPCATIIGSQPSANLTDYQVPEPWSGHIASAPILFLSSNPSINRIEKYPTWNWADTRVVDFFERRFGDGKEAWVVDGNRALQVDGTYARPTRFWGAVRGRASEVLARQAVPGVDYALTEVVHCKSREEKGVREAWQECIDCHLIPVLSISAARVLIVIGKFAHEALQHKFALVDKSELHGPVDIAGRGRMIVFLPHPASFSKSKTLAKCLSSAELAKLRTFVKGNI